MISFNSFIFNLSATASYRMLLHHFRYASLRIIHRAQLNVNKVLNAQFQTVVKQSTMQYYNSTIEFWNLKLFLVGELLCLI